MIHSLEGTGEAGRGIRDRPVGVPSVGSGLQGGPRLSGPGPGMLRTGEYWPRGQRGWLGGGGLWVGLYEKDGLLGENSSLSGNPPTLGGTIPPGSARLQGPGQKDRTQENRFCTNLHLLATRVVTGSHP